MAALKIAMVSPYSWTHPGGVNNHVKGLAREMTRRGHIVTVIAPDGKGDAGDALLVDAGRSVPLPANGSIARMAVSPLAARRVRSTVAGGGFDVVHVHEPLVPAVSTAAVKAAGSARVTGTFHAAGEGRSVIYRLGRLAYGGVVERLDARIAVSEPARDMILRYFPGEYKVVPNGVDTAFFRPGGPRPPAYPGGSRVVLFVGRNERRKGLATLLQAFKRVRDAVPESILVVIGEGYDPSMSDPSDGIVTLGYVPNEDLPAYYSNADVFCAPALGGESFGIVLIEAMACGTPVVASDIPGYRAVIESTGGGRLFSTGDAGDLARVLSGLLEDDAGRERLATQALEASLAYSWSRLGGILEHIFRKGA